MYREITSDKNGGLKELRITMYIRPIFYEDSEVFSTLCFEIPKNDKKYTTDENPSRIIYGTLFGPGEELEQPVKGEYEEFIEDCRCMIKGCGFSIIH